MQSLCSFGQIDTSDILNQSLEEARNMIAAFQKKDINTFIDYNHPKIVTLYGSRENLEYELSKDLPFQIIKTELSLPKKLIVTSENYQCVFQQKQIIKVKEQKMYTLSSLIGISYNKGEKWYFINVANNTLNELIKVFPELDAKLEIKKQTYPSLID